MSFCDCDLEPPTLYHESIVKARKAHECSDCDGEIKPRETYTRIEGLWDGRFSTYKRCQDCTVIRCDLGKIFGGCECIGMGDLQGFLWDCGDHAKTAPIIAAYNAAAKSRSGNAIKQP